MKTFLAFLSIVLLTFSGHTQNSKTSDSTKIPDEQLRTGLRIIERGKLIQVELALANLRVSILQERLTLRDSIIHAFKLGETDYKAIVGNQVRELRIESQRTDLYKETNKELQRQLKSANRKTFFAMAGGVLSIAGMTYLLLR